MSERQASSAAQGRPFRGLRASKPVPKDAVVSTAIPYPVGAVDAIVAYAKAQADGCVAVSSEYRKNKPTVVVLVASAANPERVALLHALHQSWYLRADDE